jgi:hypothetical protein
VARPKKPLTIEMFSGWKDIASYLDKGVRTVQRYERELGLPVHHPAGITRGSVVAGPVRHILPLSRKATLNMAALEELKNTGE